MNINTSITFNSKPNTTADIKFSDAEFLESAFKKYLKHSSEVFAEGPTIEIELGSLEAGLKINSISTTYSFAPGISISDTISKLQNSNIINSLYQSESNSSNNSGVNTDGLTVTIKPNETVTTTTDSATQSTKIDLSPSKVNYKNISGDVFDTTKAKPSKEEIFEMIEKTAPKYGIDPTLVKAIVQTESTFNNQCISHSGAVGLMQLMPATAKEMGLIINSTIDERWDPEKNIEAGIKYLAKYHKIISNYFGKEDWDLTLAGYNAGPNRVMQSGGIPNIKETQDYVKKVNNAWRSYK